MREIYVILNKQSIIQKMGKIELYCLFCIRAEPLVQGYAAIKPLYVYAGLV